MNGDVRHDKPALLTVGLLRPCILAHLLGGESVYGYELHHWLLAIGLECDQGTVYRALNTMEEEGLLHSTWERTSGGRSRRRYELSESGADMVDAYVPSVEQLRGVAQAFLDMRRTTSQPPDPRSEEPEGSSSPRPAPEAEEPHTPPPSFMASSSATG
jgi:DNA-binding PadR family transcriptional regulator